MSDTKAILIAVTFIAAMSFVCEESVSASPETLTYWASNEAGSLDADRRILTPILNDFTQETGVEVKLQVIPWSDLLNRILTATTSGKGPDVIDIGNTWAVPLQTTGAFMSFENDKLNAIGGRDRFVKSSLEASGMPDQPPSSIPLYGMSYGLFYNRDMLAAAGAKKPPETWDELIDIAKKLTRDTNGDGHVDQWGLALEGASYTENAHIAFVMARQLGAKLFDKKGASNLNTDAMVDSIMRYVDFVATHRIANPSNAEYNTATNMYRDFASGKVAMFIYQTGGLNGLESLDVSNNVFGVAPMPIVSPDLPQVTSHVGGVNLSIFKNTRHPKQALSFVEYMTRPDVQAKLARQFTLLPVNPAAYELDDWFSQGPMKTFQEVFRNRSVPLPRVAQETLFETLVGNAVRQLLASAAVGDEVTGKDVHQYLIAAEQHLSLAD